MSNMLYVSNFAPGTTEEQLRVLFDKYGEVKSVELGVDEKFNMPYALIEMGSGRMATKANNALNGHKIGDLYLAVSYPEVDTKKNLTSRQQKTADEIHS